MWVQFEPRDSYDDDELAGAKLAVYLNTSSNLVVLSGTDTNKCVTSKQIAPGTWHRLTVAQVTDGFNVFVDAEQLTYNDSGLFAAITEGNMSQVGFYGKGGVDNFVARTTDPFISSPAATVAGEAYATFAEALAAVSSAPEGKQYVTLLANASTTFNAAGSIAVKLNGNTLNVDYGSFAGSYSYDESTGITTYTAATVVATIVSYKYGSLQDAITAAGQMGSNTVNLVGAATGAVNIPEGITVQLADGYSLNDVTSLAGEGVLAMPTGTAPQYTVQLLCQQSTWAGTLFIHDVDINSAINLTLLGNANSTVRFNNAGCAFTTGSTTAHAIKALEIGPNGLDFIGNYSAGTFTFPCALTGTGMLKIAAKDSANGTDHKVVKFTGDVSGFTGSISFDADANCAVYFGEAAGNGNCISVAAGSSVTVAAGKTWTAPSGFVVQGSMIVNGTLNAGTEKLYGSGTITFNAATSLIVADTWTGTYNANFKAANNAIFYIPVNASATTVINGVNGEFGGYPKFGTGAPNVAGPVTLNANWTINDGWSGTGYATTFAKLSGSGNLTVNGSSSGTETIYYSITELENYKGTLGGNRGGFTIGKVNVAAAPADGECVVATAIGANGSINDNVPLFVAGVDSGKVLEYKADGANGAGLYVKASASSDVTFTFELGEGVLGVNWTAAGGSASSDLTGTAAPDTEITINSVTYSNEWYIAAGSVTNGAVLVAADTTFNVTAKKTADVDPETGDIDVTPTTVPSEVGITNGAFVAETAGSEKLSKVLTWATKSGKGGMSTSAAIEAINAMTFTEGSETQTEKAYLFNCADTPAAVAAAAAAFKFNTIDTASLPPVVSGADDVNGTVTVKGADDVDGPYETGNDSFLQTKKFFKATLTK